MRVVIKCDWCSRRVKAKPRGRPARFCSATCRQRAYERRRLEARLQAEADAVNVAAFPNLPILKNVPELAHLLAKPKLPPRQRPRGMRCPMCGFPFAVKKRGPIPETCSRRCALALALHQAYMRGVEMPFTLLKNDLEKL